MEDSNNKRPKEVIYYNLDETKVILEENNDSFQLLSMIFGVIAFMLKYKFSVWLSLTFFLSNYLDQKLGVPQMKFLMNFSLIVLAFLLIYVFPS